MKAIVSLLRSDRVYLLLFMNALQVILGYAIAVATQQASVGVMRVVKMFFLFFSLSYVVVQSDAKAAISSVKNSALILFLGIIIPIQALGSTNPLFSLNKAQAFIIPFLYTFLSVSLLIYRYGQKLLLSRFSELILLIYAIPVISYVFYGGGFSGQSIYGLSSESELVFVSNHFGWASTLLLISSFHFWRTHTLRFTTIPWVVLLYVVAAYLVVVSVNRTSMLAIALSLLVLFFRYKGLGVGSKLVLMSLPFAAFFYFKNIENSAVDFLIQRTQYQLETGTEGRMKKTEYVVEKFNEDPLIWLIGTNIFDYSIFQEESERFGGYHNSYWELLFGLGIPLFLLFMHFMLYAPLMQFIRRISRVDLVFIPLVIIPFFESNLTGGQFLFFPWFTYIFILNCHPRFYHYGVRNKPVRSRMYAPVLSHTKSGKI